MATIGFQWLLLFGCALLMLKCNAFAIDTIETTTTEEEMNNAIAKEIENQKESSKVITKLANPSELHMPMLQQVMSLMAARREDDNSMLSDEPKVITYKDFCQVLGNYQVNREKDQYDHQHESKHDNKQNAAH